MLPYSFYQFFPRTFTNTANGNPLMDTNSHYCFTHSTNSPYTFTNTANGNLPVAWFIERMVQVLNASLNNQQETDRMSVSRVSAAWTPHRLWLRFRPILQSEAFRTYPFLNKIMPLVGCHWRSLPFRSRFLLLGLLLLV